MKSRAAVVIFRREEKHIVVEKQNRLNEEIIVDNVRLIGKDGEQIGIVATNEALNLADEAGLDLVEIVPNSEPPVCRIMDFGKFQFDQNKKKHAAKKKQKQIQIKEVKFRPGHDFGSRGDDGALAKTIERQIWKFCDTALEPFFNRSV